MTANYKTCLKCGTDLGTDDIAINQKLISRNVREFMCIDCLAEYYSTTRAAIEERIEYYRKSGKCTLFR
ncbi:MAG: hypothetical protein J1E39_07470 [Eubacterium sp.]|nr:hypothetical protein [Eubacterium sp.]